MLDEIGDLYRSDAIQWVAGYSDGKDSTATLQLVCRALDSLSPNEHTKTVHVISTDTLVGNSIVAAWVTQSLETMRGPAKTQGIPIEPHRLTSNVHDTFWVSLIGKAIPTSFADANAPRSAAEIHELIAKQKLFEFKAKDPVGIVRSAIRKHLRTHAGTPSARVRAVDNDRYALP